jgi:hypothetical protein
MSSWILGKSEIIPLRRGAGDGVENTEVFIGDCTLKFLIPIYFTSSVNGGSSV